MKKEIELPYKECVTCKTLGDCKHPDVAEDMMGSPLPPSDCPRPMDIMKETIKKRKHDRSVNRGTEPLRD